MNTPDKFDLLFVLIPEDRHTTQEIPVHVPNHVSLVRVRDKFQCIFQPFMGPFGFRFGGTGIEQNPV